MWHIWNTVLQYVNCETCRDLVKASHLKPLDRTEKLNSFQSKRSSIWNSLAPKKKQGIEMETTQSYCQSMIQVLWSGSYSLGWTRLMVEFEWKVQCIHSSVWCFCCYKPNYQHTLFSQATKSYCYACCCTHHINKYVKQNLRDRKESFVLHDVPILRELIKFQFEFHVKCVVDSANKNWICPTTGTPSQAYIYFIQFMNTILYI